MPLSAIRKEQDVDFVLEDEIVGYVIDGTARIHSSPTVEQPEDVDIKRLSQATISRELLGRKHVCSRSKSLHSGDSASSQ